MANLYLHYYESTFMETLTKENFGMAKKFNNTRRYIDDLVTLNNDGYLQANVRRIYPEELKLNKENDLQLFRLQPFLSNWPAELHET